MSHRALPGLVLVGSLTIVSETSGRFWPVEGAPVSHSPLAGIPKVSVRRRVFLFPLIIVLGWDQCGTSILFLSSRCWGWGRGDSGCGTVCHVHGLWKRRKLFHLSYAQLQSLCWEYWAPAGFFSVVTLCVCVCTRARMAINLYLSRLSMCVSLCVFGVGVGMPWHMCERKETICRVQFSLLPCGAWA